MPENDLSLLVDAAHAAGKIAEQHWGNAPKTWDKPDQQGPVTEADLAIDAMLTDRLRSARPDYGWLSEETEDDPARLSAERVFIVDPIDGTRAFVNGERSFAHALAVAERGVITTAAVYLPLLDKLYTATLGQGAAFNGAAIRVSTPKGLEGSSLLATRPALDPALWPGGVPNVTRHHRPSLAYRLCLVAEGRFDGMLTLRDSWHWDIAAGALILSEAGAQVTDRAGAPLRFNTAVPSSPGVVAGGAQVHRDLIARLA